MPIAEASARPPIERGLRLAAILICLGLLGFLLSLVRIHPLAFMGFALLACPLVVAGIAVYLYSIVSHPPKK